MRSKLAMMAVACGLATSAQAVILDFSSYTVGGGLVGLPGAGTAFGGVDLDASNPDWQRFGTPTDPSNIWQIVDVNMPDIPGFPANSPALQTTGDFGIGAFLRFTGVANNYWFGFNTTVTGTNGFATVNLRSQGQFGIGGEFLGGVQGDANNWNISGNDLGVTYSSGDTNYFLFNVDVPTQTATLYLNPDLTQPAPITPTLTYSDGDLSQLPNLVSIGAGGGKTITVDNILISNISPFEVIPEPTTLALLAFGGLAIRRRR